jgi:hypothetical protein
MPMRGAARHLSSGRVLLCASVLVHGVQTTADLEWPYDPDHFRDIAQAQTIRDGGWRQDPFYRGESVGITPCWRRLSRQFPT